MLLSLRSGGYGTTTSPTVAEAAKTWIGQIERGEVRNRSGRSYKPSVVRSYETSLRLHVLPVIGSMKLTNVRRRDLQDLADQIALIESPSAVRNAMNPIRAIFRRALARGVVDSNPTEGLQLPAVDSRRDRIATPREAEALIRAVPLSDRAIWATAFYAGLRLGEIRALTIDCLDLDNGRIWVRNSWDPKEGLVDPKSSSGRRVVPIPRQLKEHLPRHIEHHIAASRFLFSEDESEPFRPGKVRRRAKANWDAQGLSPIGFHEARHTYASICIAAGIDAKKLSTYMGHSSIATTYDLYGHLFPGSEQESAAIIDDFLCRHGETAPTPIATPAGVASAE